MWGCYAYCGWHSSFYGKGWIRLREFKSAVRGFSLVHDPKGSHYENLGGEWVLKLDEANLVLNLRQN